MCPQIHVPSPVPRTWECAIMWRQGLSRGNPVELRSLGWALHEHCRCPPEKGEFGDRHIKREDGGKRHRRKTATCKPGRERPGTDHSSEPLKEPARRCLVSDISLQNCPTVNRMHHPVCGPWFWQPSRTTSVTLLL